MFEIFHQSFIQNAFLAGTCVAVVSAVVGYFVVLRSQAFAAHALSHIGFAGATGAALVGVSSLWGMFVFTIFAALGMGALGKKMQNRDIEIGMILSFALGLGVLFLRLYTSSATEAVNILFGSILSVTSTDITIIMWSGLGVLVTCGFLFRPLLFSSFDPDVAEARGVPTDLLSIVFMFLLAVTVAVATQVVGILLLFALLIVPAAVSQHMTHRPLTTVLCSIFFSIVFTWVGLFLALWGKFPVSFYIATLSALTYFVTIILSHRIQPHKEKAKHHPNREIH